MDITIEKLIYGGEGLGHHDGSTVFVPFVLARRARFRRACRTEEEIRPRARRAHPRSVARTRRAALPAFRRLRRLRLPAHALRSAAPIQSSHPARDASAASAESSGPARSPSTRRRRGAIAIARNGRFAPNRERRRRGETRDRLFPRRIDRALRRRRLPNSLAAAAEDATRSARRARGGQAPRELREIEAFAGANDSKLLLTATFARFPKKAEEVAKSFREIAPEIESLRLSRSGPRPHGARRPRLSRLPERRDDVSRRPLLILSGESFSLGRSGSRSHRTDEEGKLALDLFAGVGLFSIPLARNFSHVVAVESNPAASRDLESNARASTRHRNPHRRRRAVPREIQRQARPDRPRSAARGPGPEATQGISCAFRPSALPMFPASLPRWPAISPRSPVATTKSRRFISSIFFRRHSTWRR